MDCMIFNIQSERYYHLHSRLVCSLLFILTLFSSINCAAGLLITPSRVVFEDRTRTEQVTLNNKGSETTTYRISFIRQKMTEDGKFVAVEENEEGLYSDKIVRYSPRQITLEPGQTQIIRLMLRKPKGLADGEYRSHMLMQELPKVTKSDISKAVEQGSDEITIEITTIIGISIPVIVRNGKLDSEVTLSNVAYVKNTDPEKKSYLTMEMHRTGNRSSYGDFSVTYIDKKGQSIIVGLAKGIAVYTGNSMRRFRMPVTAHTDGEYNNGYFHIAYYESGKDEKSGLIASYNLQL